MAAMVLATLSRWMIYTYFLLTPGLVTVNAQQNTMLVECGRSSYGTPLIEDCHPLLESFANHMDTGIRVFDEEQMRADNKGSWPGAIGIVGQAYLDRIVQIPRYYTSKSCNFALLSYAGGIADYTFLGGTSWAKVNAGGNFMMTKCLLNVGNPSGGVVVVPSIMQPSKAVVSLFMWESGSIFDDIMNRFTNDPAPMIPAPGNTLMANSTTINTTGAESDLLEAFQPLVAAKSDKIF